MNINIVLDEPTHTFRANEVCKGTIIVSTSKELSHAGLSLSLEGNTSLQLSARSVGILEALSGSSQVIPHLQIHQNLVPPGKIEKGTSKFSFSLPIKTNDKLPESYHGVYIHTKYMLSASLSRGMLSGSVNESVEIFMVHTAASHDPETRSIPLHITPQTCTASLKGRMVPDFCISGKLDQDLCRLPKPLQGYIRVEHSSVPLASVDVQLFRRESISHSDEQVCTTTEIQSLQIAEGNIMAGLEIPIHVCFPKVLVCSTTTTRGYKLEFEMALLVTFENQVSVLVNYPLLFYR